MHHGRPLLVYLLMHNVSLHLLHLKWLRIFGRNHLLLCELLAVARSVPILVDLRRLLAAALHLLPLQQRVNLLSE
jgi:hypothetical protein